MKEQVMRLTSVLVLAVTGTLIGPSAGCAAKVLSWRLEPEQQYRVVVDWTSKTVIAGSSVTNGTKCDLVWTVKSVDAEGRYEIAQTLVQVKQSLQSADGTVFQYDSTSESEIKGTTAFLATYWKPLLGVERVFTMTSQGKVIESEETKALTSADNALISRAFGRDAWRTAVRQGSVVLPIEGLEPKQAWAEPQAVALPGDASKLTVTRSYTYEGETKKEDSDTPLDLIKVDNRFEIDSDAEKPSPIRIIQQSGSGEIFFDATAGRLVNSKLDQSVTLRYESKDRELDSQLTTAFQMSFQPLPKVETTAVDVPPPASP